MSQTTFEKGHINLVIGGSGSGKTVMMKCLGWIGGGGFRRTVVRRKNFFRSWQQRTQNPFAGNRDGIPGRTLFDSLTVELKHYVPLEYVYQNVARRKLDRVNFCLNRVNLVNANKLSPSGIEWRDEKRVAIARAIAPNPSYLFCDEPNSGLDPRTSIVIDNLIKEITESSTLLRLSIRMTWILFSKLETKFCICTEVRSGGREFCGWYSRTDNKELNEFILRVSWRRMWKKFKEWKSKSEGWRVNGDELIVKSRMYLLTSSHWNKY